LDIYLFPNTSVELQNYTKVILSEQADRFPAAL